MENEKAQFSDANEKGFANPRTSNSTRSPLHTIPDPLQCQQDYNCTPRVSESAHSTPARSVAKNFSVIGASTGVRPTGIRGRGGAGSSSSRVSRRFTIVNNEAGAEEVAHFDLEEDSSFWKDHNVQVLIRIRPLSKLEIVSQGHGRCLRQDCARTLVWLGHPETRFTFDHIASEKINQEKLFRVVGMPIVENCMSGYNSCMFAYGQTGSGKTYTMMGEIQRIEGKLSEECGITPRIFEYLFSEIKSVEESRRDEKLAYSCRCSFLEIYNEQITDLLRPTSTNLQLREDLKKGVFVENLSEHIVRTVDDVLQLLLQGAATRKIAATHMNSESSRSHTVFTCIVESRWEKDSMTHLRFGRLNLVDLAGSERQKSSGAEGDSLKEAANINKSLSTLGLVIMSLVDMAHGKHRHVPYRDSKLTFLLQDSLGGNSKTAIIANVSPSLSSANETLGTLKFAQRAKLIQNNAKVNEDAAGDVTSLQRQVQQLKAQLSCLLKHPSLPSSLSPMQSCAQSGHNNYFEKFASPEEGNISGEPKDVRVGKCKEIAYLEASLVDAIRREKMNQTTMRKLKAEIEHLNHVVEAMSSRSGSGYEITSFSEAGNGICDNEYHCNMTDMLIVHPSEPGEEQLDAGLLIEALKVEQVSLTEALMSLQGKSKQLRAKLESGAIFDLGNDPLPSAACTKNKRLLMEETEGLEERGLEIKLDKLTRGLEEARFLNLHCQEDRAFHIHQEKEVELVREQVELETAKTIHHLQDEVDRLHVELNEKLCCMTSENVELRNTLAAKDEQMKSLHMEWEKATLELTMFLADGSKSLNDASTNVKSIASLFPQINFHLAEHIEKAARICIEKEATILMLQKNMEDAQKTALEMDQKLNSLKSATIAFTELQKFRGHRTDERPSQLKEISDYEESMTNMSKSEFPCTENGFDGLKGTESTSCFIDDKIEDHFVFVAGAKSSKSAMEDTEACADFTRLIMRDFETQVSEFFMDAKNNLFRLYNDASEAYIVCCELVRGLLKDTHDMRKSVMNFKEKPSFPFHRALSSEKLHSPEMETRCHLLRQIQEGLADTNNRLGSIQASIDKILECNGCSSAEDLFQADNWTTDSSTSDSSLDVGVSSGEQDEASSTSRTRCFFHATEEKIDLEDEHILNKSCNKGAQKFNMLPDCSSQDEETSFLRNELEIALRAFNKLYIWLSVLCTEKDVTKSHNVKCVCLPLSSVSVIDHQEDMCKTGDQVSVPEMTSALPYFESGVKGTKSRSHNAKKLIVDGNFEEASTFFTKFEEAHTTIKEADCMLNALVKANENAKRMSNIWKQVEKQRDCLLEQVQELKLTLRLKNAESEAVNNEFHFTLVEIANTVSSVEQTFFDLKRDIDVWLKEIYSDVLSMREHTQHHICSMRSLTETVFSELIVRDITSLVLHGYVMEYLGMQQQGCSSKEILESTSSSHKLVAINAIYNADGMMHNERAVLSSQLQEVSCHECNNVTNENLLLKKELEWKEVLLKGLLFDFSLLQESASNFKDKKDENEKLVSALYRVEYELKVKQVHLDDMIAQTRSLEDSLVDTKDALSTSNSELEQSKILFHELSGQNAELRLLIHDLYDQKSELENRLKEQREVINSLEEEILKLNFCKQEQNSSLVRDLEDAVRRVTRERDQLMEEVLCLNDKLEMAYTLAEEKEALATEAREDLKAAKLCAMQKEEEVKILERSIEELESTVNVLEKQVYEMNDEVQRHQVDRNSLDHEVQALRRCVTFGDLTVITDIQTANELEGNEGIQRQLSDNDLSLHEAYNQIEVLKDIRRQQEKEIERLKAYVAELQLHTQAQASQFQQKYKTLETMVRDMRKDSSSLSLEKSEQSSTRIRGSSSPFRCITNLIQQMNVENDQELSTARLRIEELEGLASSQQKEVCMLNSRLAAAESMTHDVIRDLLGLKQDMTDYADMLDQCQLQRLLDSAQQELVRSNAKEEEILELRKQIHSLIEERESYVMELNRRDAEMLAAQLTVEQLKERDQFLTVQNEMLKVEKTNLTRRLAEVDELMNELLERPRPTAQRQSQHSMKEKDKTLLR